MSVFWFSSRAVDFADLTTDFAEFGNEFTDLTCYFACLNTERSYLVDVPRSLCYASASINSVSIFMAIIRYPSIQIKYPPGLLARVLHLRDTIAPTIKLTMSVTMQALIMYAKDDHDYGAQCMQKTDVFPWVNAYRMAGDVHVEKLNISVTEAWQASSASGLQLDSKHAFAKPSEARDAVLIALWTSLESHGKQIDADAFLACLNVAKRIHGNERASARRNEACANIDAITAPKTSAMSEAVTSCIDAVFAHFCPQLALDEELADTFTTEFKAKRVLKTLSDAQR